MTTKFDNILSMGNRLSKINDIIEVKKDVYLHETKTNIVNNSKRNAEFE